MEGPSTNFEFYYFFFNFIFLLFLVTLHPIVYFAHSYYSCLFFAAVIFVPVYSVRPSPYIRCNSHTFPHTALISLPLALARILSSLYDCFFPCNVQIVNIYV